MREGHRAGGPLPTHSERNGMSQSFFDETEESRGFIPSLTGAKLRIEEIERTKTGENAATPGCLMYVVTFSVVEPAKFKGLQVRKWFVIGTAEDKKGEKPETWAAGAEKGPGQLKRMLVRAAPYVEGDISKDDEEWMEAAEGKIVVAPVIDKGEKASGPRNAVGKFYRETDSDCPEIGEAEAGGAKKAKLKVVKKAAQAEADEDEAPAPVAKKRAANDDEDDD